MFLNDISDVQSLLSNIQNIEDLFDINIRAQINNDKRYSKLMPLQKQLVQIQDTTNNIQTLFVELEKACKLTSGLMRRNPKSLSVDQNDKLSSLMYSIYTLNDKNTFKIFTQVFSNPHFLENLEKRASDDVMVQFHALNGFFKTQSSSDPAKSIFSELKINFRNKKKVRELGQQGNAQLQPNEIIDNIANKLTSEEKFNKYVMILNDSLQNLEKLNITLSQLESGGSKVIKEYNKDLTHAIEHITTILTSSKSPLWEERITAAARLDNFLNSPDYQKMQYELADLKFRFTTHLQKEFDENQSNFSRTLNLSNEQSVYNHIRNITGFSKLEANKDSLNYLENTVEVATRKRVKDILHYMDGMISVRSLIYQNAKDSSNPWQAEHIANAIMMGLDSDSGFGGVLKQRFKVDDQPPEDYSEVKKKEFTDMRKRAYDAYVGGCIEECMINSSSGLFKRDDGKENQKNFGNFKINKPRHKLQAIKSALGLGENGADVFEFVKPENFDSKGLDDLYEASKSDMYRKIRGMHKPIYLLLASLKPLKFEDTNSISPLEAEELGQKVSNYHKILDTLKVGWGFPGYGRLRTSLDMTNQDPSIKAQARGVFDRLLNFYQRHQTELSQLPNHKTVEFQNKNREVFKDTETFSGWKALKSIGKNMAGGLIQMLGYVPDSGDVSDQKRRIVQYKFLKGKNIANVGADDLKDILGFKKTKYQSIKESDNPADAFVQAYIQPKGRISKAKFEKIYDELKEQDIVEQIRAIINTYTNFRSIISSNYDKKELGTYKENVKDIFLLDLKSRLLPEEVPQDKKTMFLFGKIMKMMSERFDKVYDNVGKIPDYLLKYDSATQLLEALDQQQKNQSIKYDQANQKINLDAYLKPVHKIQAQFLTEEDIELAKRKSEILTQYPDKYLTDLFHLKMDTYMNTNETEQRRKLDKEIIAIKAELDSRDLNAKMQEKINRRMSTRDMKGVNIPDESYSFNGTSMFNSYPLDTSKSVEEQLIGGGAAYSDVVEESKSDSSNREPRSNSLAQSSMFDKSIPPLTKEDFVNQVIKPLRTELKKLITEGGNDENKKQTLVSQLEEKLSEWNKFHSGDQLRYKDDKYNIESVNRSNAKTRR